MNYEIAFGQWPKIVKALQNDEHMGNSQRFWNFMLEMELEITTTLLAQGQWF